MPKTNKMIQKFLLQSGLSEICPDCDCMACEIGWIYDDTPGQLTWTAFWLLLIFIFCFIQSCHHQPALTREFTNEEIAQAIKKKEGIRASDKVASYGIKSIPCRTQSQCHAVCLRTIQNDRRRFISSSARASDDFISFLGSRYCPDTDVSCQDWADDIRYILNKG